MKSSVIEKCKSFYQVIAEKCMEVIEQLRFWLMFREGYTSNLVEKYTIKQEYMNEDFVKIFLKEREKIISGNRYRMAVIEDKVSEGKEVIGHVELYSGRKFIDRATLVTKPGNNEKTRLIYWKFE